MSQCDVLFDFTIQYLQEVNFVSLKYVMMHPESTFGFLVYAVFMASFPPFDFQVCNCVTQWYTPGF